MILAGAEFGEIIIRSVKINAAMISTLLYISLLRVIVGDLKLVTICGCW